MPTIKRRDVPNRLAQYAEPNALRLSWDDNTGVREPHRYQVDRPAEEKPTARLAGLLAEWRLLFEMGNEPISSRRRSFLEIFHVGVEMASGHCDEFLWLKRAFLGSERLVGDGQVVTKSYNHEERCRADEFDVGSGLVFGEHLDGAQRYLVTPSRRARPCGLREPRP